MDEGSHEQHPFLFWRLLKSRSWVIHHDQTSLIRACEKNLFIMKIYWVASQPYRNEWGALFKTLIFVETTSKVESEVTIRFVGSCK